MVDPARAASPTLLACATGDLPGIGGHLKAAPDDFVVEELPAYEPCGRGEHLYLWVEKRGLSTAGIISTLGRVLNVSPLAIGAAGKKDAQAVTRQWLSVHTAADPNPARLSGDGWRVLAANRHRNKLRPGHLRGNRFSIAVRGAQQGPETAILARLEHDGFPNYFGPQRLGPAHANALVGRELLRRTRSLRGNLERLRFAVNAYQAALFNGLVARRLAIVGDLQRLLPGDLAVLHRNGAAFAVTDSDLETAQARAAAHEISASAPLFGYRTSLAEGEPGSWERAALSDEQLTPEAFRLGGHRVSPKGERRAVRVFAEALTWAWDATGGEPVLRLSFTLAPGVYATTLLRELTKADDLTALPAPDADAHGSMVQRSARAVPDAHGVR
ncbi:MAG TPA: tRNA pseudouridine(13) synthase TruD [bacterium]|nr:tRNA pseudouridine(13) synthase TruD [bacterium]